MRDGTPNFIGILALIVGASMWAIYTVCFRRSGLKPLQAAAIICFWSAVFFVPIYIVMGLSRLAHASAHELIFQIIYQGSLMSAVAVVAFNRAVALLGSAAAAAIIALIPVVASALAIPFLGEMPSAVAGGAIVTISIGVALAARPAPSTAES